MPAFPFQNSYSKLPESFYWKQNPTPVANPRLIAANESLAHELGIETNWLQSPEAAEVFAGNTVPDGAEPLAQAYAGHQFGGFSPQLGDGRALLLGEVASAKGRRDIQLKGSGPTPFSRRGDGRSALGPVLREYLLSEAMHALGVPTTRALAAVVTGDTVYRQEGEVAGGVFTRVAASHLRVGTFQYFYAKGDHDSLRTLADYAIERHYPDAATAENPYQALLAAVIEAQAKLIAQWMSLGFIHGVMNTDNCAISGETIDYGPCAFMEGFHPHCVFSSIDRNSRYAWGNQAAMGLWNLSRFAETLLELLDSDSEKAKLIAETELENYHQQFANEYQARFCAKLGLPLQTGSDFVRVTLETLAEHFVDFTLFFRLLTRFAESGDNAALLALFRDQQAGQDWLKLWQTTVHDQPDATTMQAVNPVRIPRNHQVEAVIQAGYQGDFTPFQRLHAALSAPYEESEEHVPYEAKASPEQMVHETFCGT